MTIRISRANVEAPTSYTFAERSAWESGRSVAIYEETDVAICFPQYRTAAEAAAFVSGWHTGYAYTFKYY